MKKKQKNFLFKCTNTQNIFSALVVDKNQPTIEIEVEEKHIKLIYKK